MTVPEQPAGDAPSPSCRQDRRKADEDGDYGWCFSRPSRGAFCSGAAVFRHGERPQRTRTITLPSRNSGGVSRV
jgi:hypothetical protein